MVMIPAYRPVIRVTAGAYRATALVGTHSVSLGWDVDPPQRAGLLGFAVRKTEVDLATGDVIAVNWLRGEKRFKNDPIDGFDVSSRDAPFQRFRWNDYTLKSDLGYVFDIFPVRGQPGVLTTDEPPLTLKLRPSPEMADGVGAYVNRGVTSAFCLSRPVQGAASARCARWRGVALAVARAEGGAHRLHRRGGVGRWPARRHLRIFRRRGRGGARGGIGARGRRAHRLSCQARRPCDREERAGFAGAWPDRHRHPARGDQQDQPQQIHRPSGRRGAGADLHRHRQFQRKCLLLPDQCGGDP